MQVSSAHKVSAVVRHRFKADAEEVGELVGDSALRHKLKDLMCANGEGLAGRAGAEMAPMLRGRLAMAGPK